MRVYPQHFRDYTEEDKEAAIAMFMKKSMREIRKHQTILSSQIQHAFNHRKTDALQDLQGMYDLTVKAVFRKCFCKNIS